MLLRRSGIIICVERVVIILDTLTADEIIIKKNPSCQLIIK